MLLYSVLFYYFFSTGVAEAKVMWGKTELKQGQIGKVTIVTNVNAVKLNGNNILYKIKGLKKQRNIRVYSYRVIGDSGYYGLVEDFLFKNLLASNTKLLQKQN